MKIEGTRFGPVEVREDALIRFPEGVIGLPGRAYALLSPAPDAVFFWLQSVEHPAVALPVTLPWLFFPGYEVRLAADTAARLDLRRVEPDSVLCVVRAAAELAEFRINLRAPIVVRPAGLTAHQVINEAGDHGVAERLFANVDLAAVGSAVPPAPVAALGG